MKHKIGFSLVELMVALVILAIISAIAVPSYRTYVAKSNIAVLIGTLESMKTDLLSYYSLRGSWPTSLSTQGETLTRGVGSTVLDDSIDSIFFDVDSSNNVAWVGIYASEQVGDRIPKFQPVAVEGGLTGARNARLVMGFKLDVQDSLLTYCGRLESGDVDIPQSLLPSGCNLDDVYNDFLLNS